MYVCLFALYDGLRIGTHQELTRLPRGEQPFKVSDADFGVVILLRRIVVL